MKYIPIFESNKWFINKPDESSTSNYKALLFFIFNFSSRICINLISQVEKWKEMYKKDGLLTVGIHSPEFDFESDPNKLKLALDKLKTGLPIYEDGENIFKEKLEYKENPAIFIADKDRIVVFEHFDDTLLSEIEKKLRSTLVLESKDVVLENDHVHDSSCFKPTRNLYLGYEKGAFRVSKGGSFIDQEVDFNYPETFQDNAVSMDGTFFVAKQYLETREKESEISVKFISTELNLVAEAQGGKIYVKLDGNTLPGELFGIDVSKDGELDVNSSGNYNLIKNSRRVEGIVKLKLEGEGMKLYKFEFSGCLRKLKT